MRHIGTTSQSFYFVLNIHYSFECLQSIFLIFPIVFDDIFSVLDFEAKTGLNCFYYRQKCSRGMDAL